MHFRDYFQTPITMQFKNLLLILLLGLVSTHLQAQTRKMTKDCKLSMSSSFQIDISNDGKERQFPFVYKFGNSIFISYSEHHDAVIASPQDAMIISHDNGVTWKNKLRNKDFYMTSMFKKNGTLYGIVYFTYPVSSDKEKMIYWTSKNDGKTWTKHEGVVNAPEGKKFRANGVNRIWGSMLFHRGMQVMKDGSVQGVMYGYFEGDDKYRVVWVKSTDNCATWNIVSTVAYGVPEGDFKKAEGYCEPTFAKTKDGSILCVMRMGSFLPLFQSRSNDNGLTWSKPVELPGLSSDAAQSVDPQLLLMKNGILALTYGRPGDRIALSYDGCGYQWNCSSITREEETTGYTGIVETAPGKLLLIADEGRTGAQQMAIWGSFVHVAK